MATAATKQSASQNSIKYALSSTGAGSLTQTTLLADCVPGPLKSFLAGLNTNALWDAGWPGTAAAVANAGKLSVTLTPTLSPAAATAVNPSAFFSSITNRHIDINQATEGNTILELRFHPTPEQ
jgi:hypothetical protein